ncbi:MAG TPA: cobyric acid synthase [Candidatus Binataceae bacterium]
MKARAIMIVGTASHVGKSWMATALCRWLARKGRSVAPFKAQNMSNNSYPCPGGGEIGRAQVAQAQACFLTPEPDMNPILLKPNSDVGSQIVLNGRMWRNLGARAYYEQFPFLLGEVLAAYHRLASRYEFIVIEGAGSISELNLKNTDLVNLGLAKRIEAPVLLVADIDRGGVFASVFGTFALLEDDEKALVRSFAINRFRGDPSLFAGGADLLEIRSQRPCIGVFPFLHGVELDAEDGVSLDDSAHSESDIAIVRLPHISNFTDFRLLPGVCWLSHPSDRRFKYVILPGTKNTIGDLRWLRRNGLADWVMRQYRDGATVIGICGGYQMLGKRIEDPMALESSESATEGLDLLPVRTVMEAEKRTRTVEAVTPSGIRFSAYEIHLGRTTRPSDAVPFATLADGAADGIRTERCIGTYLHGALENPVVLGELLGRPVEDAPSRSSTYDALADWFDANVNRARFEKLYLSG